MTYSLTPSVDLRLAPPDEELWVRFETPEEAARVRAWLEGPGRRLVETVAHGALKDSRETFVIEVRGPGDEWSVLSCWSTEETAEREFEYLSNLPTESEYRVWRYCPAELVK